MGYGPWGRKELDKTGQLTLFFHLHRASGRALGVALLAPSWWGGGGRDSSPRGRLTYMETFLVVTTWGGVQLTTGGWRLGSLLNTLMGKKAPPQTMIQPQSAPMPRLRKDALNK